MIKDKMKKWLFGKEIEEFNQSLIEYECKISDVELECHKARSAAINALKELTEVKEEFINCKKLMNSICEVGVDVHRLPHEQSWAVICVHGKMDYVKFCRFSPGDLRQLRDFLRRFEYSNRVVDAPSGFDDLLVRSE